MNQNMHDPERVGEPTPYDLAFFKKYNGTDQVIDAEAMRVHLAKQNRAKINFNTGIAGLDQLVKGVNGGELIVVGGKRKNGKTTLCQTLTDNFNKQNAHTLWFEYEVPVWQFMEQMDPATNFYVPMTLVSNGLGWMTERIMEGMLKHNIQIVFIDHLHYLIDLSRAKNPSLEIGSIVRKLKMLAIEFNIVVFLVSHVRNIEPGVEVTEDHLRDSSLTSAEADTTWIVSRLMDKKTKAATDFAKVSVRNHRRTGVMAQSVRLVKSGKYFDEVHNEYDSTEEENVDGEEDRKQVVRGKRNRGSSGPGFWQDGDGD